MPAITPQGPQVSIRDLREAHGLSISQLADRIWQIQGGEKPPHGDTIRNVELGHKRASAPLITAWARALGLTPLDVWQPDPRARGAREVA